VSGTGTSKHRRLRVRVGYLKWSTRTWAANKQLAPRRRTARAATVCSPLLLTTDSLAVCWRRQRGFPESIRRRRFYSRAAEVRTRCETYRRAAAPAGSVWRRTEGCCYPPVDCQHRKQATLEQPTLKLDTPKQLLSPRYSKPQLHTRNRAAYALSDGNIYLG